MRTRLGECRASFPMSLAFTRSPHPGFPAGCGPVDDFSEGAPSHENRADRPLIESCRPKLYGGTERIVSYLTEEFARQGHQVTLFASGDSRTSPKLVRCSDMALRLNG